MKSILYKLFVGELSWKRLFRSLILIPLFVYVGLFVIALFFSDKLLFRPPPPFYKDDDRIIKLTTPSGQKISARFFPNENAKYTILFSHGNAEDLGTIESFAETVRSSGFSVFAYDYRGYGTSEGLPSETNAYDDIRTAFDYLVQTKQIPPDRIILHGRSLGGGPSTDLASKQRVAGLILESAFTSAGRVLANYKIFPFDKFDNIDKLVNVSCPILVIHGKNDRTISFVHGQTLFAAAKEPKSFLWVENAGHNNLNAVAGENYLSAIRYFAAALSDRSQ